MRFFNFDYYVQELSVNWYLTFLVFGQWIAAMVITTWRVDHMFSSINIFLAKIRLYMHLPLFIPYSVGALLIELFFLIIIIIIVIVIIIRWSLYMYIPNLRDSEGINYFGSLMQWYASPPFSKCKICLQTILY